MALRIGQLAKRAGLTVRALHHYDAIGLLSPSARSDGGFRLYDQADVMRLHKIQALKQFGCALADIRDVLQEGEVSLPRILARQLEVLDEQVRQAKSLRDKLARLRERLVRHEATGMGDWLTTLEMMHMYEQYFSGDELAVLRSGQCRDGRPLEGEWRELVATVRAAMDQGMSPEGEEARELAWRWMRLIRETTGNDVALVQKLKALQMQEPRVQEVNGITPDVMHWMRQAMTGARMHVLAGYLSPDELAAVRVRQERHRTDWPPLVIKARRLLEQDASPDDPDVRELAGVWETLFRDSYCGDDSGLETKIRRAFKAEPGLLGEIGGIGMDAALAAFMGRAVAALHGAGGDSNGRVDDAPSTTALAVAMLRAAHQIFDTPLVFEDRLACRILGAHKETFIRENPSRYNADHLRGLRASVVVRSRLAEDAWAVARQRGVRQYVILGAGLDTSAYRDPDPACRIFEIDRPQTQAWKRKLLREAGMNEPSTLSFVPVDFERTALAEALDRAGVKRDAPVFFSWLGVTMYLAEATVLGTLEYIASHASGSGILFDYAVVPELLTPGERAGREAVMARSAERGETWKSAFDPAGLVAALTARGFGLVEDWGAPELNARYLAGRADGLRKSGGTRIALATIQPPMVR